MIRSHRSSSAGTLAAIGFTLLSAAFVLACASEPTELVRKRPVMLEAEGLLAGETLSQRKLEMRRAHRDLKFFYGNYESLTHHRQKAEMGQLAGFLRSYLAGPVDDALSTREEAWNPELAQLDANLLFAKAHVLLELEDRAAVGRVRAELEQRFRDMDNLVVEYPIGSETTLKDGITDIRRAALEL